ncbi:MAG TPA: hypothetical protein VFE54_03565 [Mucilaginibacter sp.]|jgi:hypothetical protein|nr:hypothetical protein [Mucilaginibacter sp.]
MKRTALILLTAIYLLSCVGMGINRFYCCGKLAAITLIYGAPDNTKKEPGKNNNCCRDEKQSFKVKDSHFSAASFSLKHPIAALLTSFIDLQNEAIVNQLHTKIVYKGNAPPGHSDIPVYTLNCAYRI